MSLWTYSGNREILEDERREGKNKEAIETIRGEPDVEREDTGECRWEGSEAQVREQQSFQHNFPVP